VNLADEVAKHGFGNLEIGDYTILQWADGDDVAGRAAEHSLGLVAHGKDAIGALLNRNDRGLAENDALVFDINECICGAEIDAYVARKKSKKIIKHRMGSGMVAALGVPKGLDLVRHGERAF
jgi:hypothetical protein